jgi:signal transduction histidine kinase
MGRCVPVLVIGAIGGTCCVAAATSQTGPEPVSSAFDTAISTAKTAMMADPASAMKPVLLAENLALRLPTPNEVDVGRATAAWLHGEVLSRINEPEKALPILQSALREASAASPRSKLEADVTLARGTAETALGDVRASLADFQRSYELYVALGDGRGQAKALLSMGGIYSDAGDNDRSLRYYSQVPDVYRGDPAIDLAAHNNLGETLKKLGRFKEAEGEYEKALAAAAQLASPMLQTRILTNLASAQLQDGALDKADANVGRALARSSQADAAGWRPYIWGVKAQIAARRGDYALAASDLDRAFSGVDLGTSTLPFRDFHQTAYVVYQHLGRYDLALRHLEAFKRLDDEAQKLTASSSAALVTARFDFANQNLHIARLRAEKVRQEAVLQQSRARLRTILFSTILAAAALVLALLLAGFVSLSRSRNRVRAANARLTVANDSLQQALRVETEFLATTSHEIRTPLNGILGMTQVLLADRSLAAPLRERIEVVHGAGETMRMLVDDILDVAKIETGHLTLSRVDMDLALLLAEAARLWQGEAETKSLTLISRVQDAPQWIHEDEARLRQILFNLMSNALKFTHQGEVQLRAFAMPGDDGERLVVEVEDTGIGIPQDKQELIFESFRQADGGTDRQYGGTGLGLSICRNLARAMGGEVTIESHVGKGSCFRLSLPLTRVAARMPVPVTRRERPTQLRDAALLVVDANPLTQRIIANSLASACADVTTTGAAEDALGQLAGRSVDHVLVEANACGSGRDERIAMLRSLVEAADRVDARVSILFAPSEELGEPHLLPLGADQLIAKPIGAGMLLQALLASYDTLQDASPALRPGDNVDEPARASLP